MALASQRAGGAEERARTAEQASATAVASAVAAERDMSAAAVASKGNIRGRYRASRPLGKLGGKGNLRR